MCRVAWSEETLSADEQIGMVFTPEHAAAPPKVILDAFYSLRHGFDYKESPTYVERALFFGQRCGLFRGKAVTSCCRVILGVSPGGLGYQPLADVTFICIGSLG